MARKTLSEHLFDTLERLSDATPETIQLEIDKAASIVAVSENILNVAQTKINIINATNGTGEGFGEIIEQQKLLTNDEEEDFTEEIIEEELDEHKITNYGNHHISEKTLAGRKTVFNKEF